MAECDTSGQEELSPEVGLLEHFAGKPLSSPHLQMGTARSEPVGIMSHGH